MALGHTDRTQGRGQHFHVQGVKIPSFPDPIVELHTWYDCNPWDDCGCVPGQCNSGLSGVWISGDYVDDNRSTICTDSLVLFPQQESVLYTEYSVLVVLIIWP